MWRGSPHMWVSRVMCLVTRHVSRGSRHVSRGLRHVSRGSSHVLNYSLGDQKIPEASCCKYLGIIIRSDLSWADQVNYTVQKAWRALHFVMRIVKRGNKNTKSLAYTSLVRPILEMGAACWDPYRECQISALDRVKNKTAKFAHHSGGSRLGIFGTV